MNRATDDACLDKSVVGMKPTTKICLRDTLHFHGCMFFRLLIITPIWSKVYKQGKVEMNNLFFEDCPMSLISFFAELPKFQGWAALWTSVESFKFSARLFSRLSFFFFQLDMILLICFHVKWIKNMFHNIMEYPQNAWKLIRKVLVCSLTLNWV